jgi:hypothetical protein
LGVKCSTNRFRLNNMSATVKKRNPSRELAARQAYLQKSNMQIENETEGIIYQKLLSRLKSGEKSLETLDIKELKALLFVMEWSPQDFEEATAIELVKSELGPVLHHVPLETSKKIIPTFLLPTSPSEGIKSLKKASKPVVFEAEDDATYEAFILDDLGERFIVTWIIRVFAKDETPEADAKIICDLEGKARVATFSSKIGNTYTLRIGGKSVTSSDVALRGEIIETRERKR